jgi:hypothetical protein
LFNLDLFVVQIAGDVTCRDNTMNQSSFKKPEKNFFPRNEFHCLLFYFICFRTCDAFGMTQESHYHNWKFVSFSPEGKSMKLTNCLKNKRIQVTQCLRTITSGSSWGSKCWFWQTASKLKGQNHLKQNIVAMSCLVWQKK